MYIFFCSLMASLFHLALSVSPALLATPHRALQGDTLFLSYVATVLFSHLLCFSNSSQVPIIVPCSFQIL